MKTIQSPLRILILLALIFTICVAMMSEPATEADIATDNLVKTLGFVAALIIGPLYNRWRKTDRYIAAYHRYILHNANI